MVSGEPLFPPPPPGQKFPDTYRIWGWVSTRSGLSVVDKRKTLVQFHVLRRVCKDLSRFPVKIWRNVSYWKWKCMPSIWLKGLYSVVGIATRYGLEGPRIRIPVRARFSALIQTVPGAHPTSCTMGIGSFPGVKAAGAWRWPPTPSSAEVMKE